MQFSLRGAHRELNQNELRKSCSLMKFEEMRIAHMNESNVSAAATPLHPATERIEMYQSAAYQRTGVADNTATQHSPLLNSAANLSQPQKPGSRSSKKLARYRKKAEQAEAYRKQLSEIIVQNTHHLSSCAEKATEIVPSAAPLVSGIVAAYSLSGGMLKGKFQGSAPL